MDPIKNANADYLMAMPQGQDNQIQDMEEYSQIPMMYEPEMEEKKKASSNLLGMTAVGIIAAVTAGIIGHKMGGKGLSEYKAAAEEATKKYNDVLKEKETIQKGKEEAEKVLGEYRSGGCKAWWKRLGRLFRPGAFYSDEEKAARNAFQEAEKAAKKAEKAAKKVEKEAKDTAEKVEKKVEKKAEKAAEDTAKKD